NRDIVAAADAGHEPHGSRDHRSLLGALPGPRAVPRAADHFDLHAIIVRAWRRPGDVLLPHAPDHLLRPDDVMRARLALAAREDPRDGSGASALRLVLGGVQDDEIDRSPVRRRVVRGLQEAFALARARGLSHA